ncbi:hypothetical protein BJV78DRAFT_1154868 [Lactifluus subvellereus]|nr:hypothetical protein BJV78DRAFT_1154868 [Lactifluus subvellereus]
MPLHRHQLQAPGSSPTKGPPPPRVVRRVQAVIGVPVEEEEAGEECFDLDAGRLPDAGVLHPTSMPTCGGGVGQRKSSAGSHYRSEARLRVVLMNKKHRRMRPMAENPWMKRRLGTRWVHPQRMGRLQWGRKRICHELDEEDGLMIRIRMIHLPPRFRATSKWKDT